ncbi:MAG TPA: hypothetical protein VF665_03825 [Longimicrobium sp.]|jgi:hypothetical protein|uniref:hypothetical protein n=1 Tax=Longimicrobium sp. TaxID=2029185 RepID=UPI002ED98A1D
MACPAITLTGITAEVWECCRREARRLGVTFPDTDTGSVHHADADADYTWNRNDGTLQVTFTRTPSYIRCEMIEMRLREGARLCGAR